MQVTSLNGVSYASTRTTSRDHQADTAARERYLSGKSKDAKRRKATDGFANSISHWRRVQHNAEQFLTNDSKTDSRKASEERSIANALDKIAKLRVHEANTRAAIGR